MQCCPVTDVKCSAVAGGGCATCSAPGIGVLADHLCANGHPGQFAEIPATIQGISRNEELVRNKER